MLLAALRQPRAERCFYRTDDRSDAAQDLVLFGVPTGPSVPPRRRSEHGVETRARELSGATPAQSRRPSQEPAAAGLASDSPDQVGKEFGGDAIEPQHPEACYAGIDPVREPVAPLLAEDPGGFKVVEPCKGSSGIQPVCTWIENSPGARRTDERVQDAPRPRRRRRPLGRARCRRSSRAREFEHFSRRRRAGDGRSGSRRGDYPPDRCHWSETYRLSGRAGLWARGRSERSRACGCARSASAKPRQGQQETQAHNRFCMPTHARALSRRSLPHAPAAAAAAPYELKA